ncbi:MAG: RagB/SusD family nutrient uptake outer membrane protein [Gemmatimonadaceae bacterium]
MKRNRLPVAAMALATVIAGCVSIDENLVTGVSSQYYATPDGLNSALISSYAQLRGFYGKEQLLSLTQVGTDTWQAGDQLGSNNINFDAYNGILNSQAAELANTWNPAYVMINTLNAALDRGPNTSGIAPATKNALLGEAHFLRALQYFTLVQAFGDVTLSLHENQGVVLEATRQPAADVYKAIIADLDTAISQLPATTNDYGRATRGAALTLRSKVYLTRAYKSYGAGAADFTAALTDAKAVISSGTYALEPVYADLWCVARAGDPGRGGYCDNTGYVQNRKEFIFTVQFSYNQPNNDADGTPQYNYLHLVYGSQYDNNNAGVGIARDLNNGRPFRRLKPTQYELSLWSQRYAGTPGASDILDTRFDGSFQTVWYATAGGQRNPVGVCPTGPLPINSSPQFVACTSNQVVNVGDTTIFYATFPVDSVRRRASKYTIRTTCPAGIADPSVYCGDNFSENNGYIGWDRFPVLKKFQDNLRTGGFNDQNGGKVQVLFRLGEVYLIAAEAALGLNNLTEAAANINVLRTRAASPAHKADPAFQVTPAQINLDFIMDERERELAGEFNRWYDLVRPGPTFFLSRVQKWNPKARPNVQAKHALRPIPQSQIDGVVVGPKYPQNPGY